MQNLYAQQICVTERTKLNESFFFVLLLNLDVCLLKNTCMIVFT